MDQKKAKLLNMSVWRGKVIIATPSMCMSLLSKSSCNSWKSRENIYFTQKTKVEVDKKKRKKISSLLLSVCTWMLEALHQSYRSTRIHCCQPLDINKGDNLHLCSQNHVCSSYGGLHYSERMRSSLVFNTKLNVQSKANYQKTDAMS